MNLHGEWLPHQPLKLARLPISPRPHALKSEGKYRNGPGGPSMRGRGLGPARQVVAVADVDVTGPAERREAEPEPAYR